MAGLLAARLDRGLRYLIVGSLASNFHGIPRATHDADFVLDLERHLNRKEKR